MYPTPMKNRKLPREFYTRANVLAVARQLLGKLLGVPAQDIVLDRKSKNTEEEAVFIFPTVGKAPFVLVTSASHMPRAMGLFRKLGMNPIAAPTDYLAKGHRSWEPDTVFPGYYGLYESERAVYEYLGITWETFNHEM